MRANGACARIKSFLSAKKAKDAKKAMDCFCSICVPLRSLRTVLLFALASRTWRAPTQKLLAR